MTATNTKPEPPKSCAIHVRRLSDDLSVWSVTFKVDVDDLPSLDRLAAKAQQTLKGLEHALVGRLPIGEFGNTFDGNATTHYVDEMGVTGAMQEVRDYFAWLKKEDARKPRVVIAGPGSVPPEA